ncbi:hypothetical protein Gotri_008111, partial [Gossypium trilobum]|nr:hypothetical protein [Gossypium trilobum]
GARIRRKVGEREKEVRQNSKSRRDQEVAEQDDNPSSLLHLRKGNFLCFIMVIGNKWDTYLDLLQADYTEGFLTTSPPLS